MTATQLSITLHTQPLLQSSLSFQKPLMNMKIEIRGQRTSHLAHYLLILAVILAVPLLQAEPFTKYFLTGGAGVRTKDLSHSSDLAASIFPSVLL